MLPVLVSAIMLAQVVPSPASAQESGIAIDTLTLASRRLGRPRMVRVFLPPGYAQSQSSYPVLYANDGQDMEAVLLRTTLARLYAAGEIEPVVVVAIHATDARIREYGTAGTPNAQGYGREASAYSRVVLEELMPIIERRYRVRKDAAHTAIIGWSLGGLSAFDIAWRHSDRFSAVGVFSGSFWWRTDDSSPMAKQASRIMHRAVRETRGHPKIRMWFEAGRRDETEDRDGNGVIDAIQDTGDLIAELTAKGYRLDEDIVFVEAEGGHNRETWAGVLPQFLLWAYKRDTLNVKR